jgi:Tfp pilus assembly protein PilX
MKKPSEKGQMLLIVVLIMVVALTVGLSIAARSLVNLKIATDDENSQRAFSAAEAGIERLIKTDCSTM